MTQMINSQETSYFESEVTRRFAFLEAEYKMQFTGVRRVCDGDPRDSGLVARYRVDGFRIDIGWSAVQQALSVLIHLSNTELPRHSRYVYLDSFVEFITEGKEPSIVPQIYPRMSEASIIDAMKRRQELLDNRPVAEVLGAISEKLRRHLHSVIDASVDLVLRYHEWMARKK